LSGMTETSAGTTAIRPFTVPIVPDAELEDLRARIRATRWPDPELVDDHSQGVQLAVIQELARYWATEYDWRRFEAKLSALPHFMTEIDGLDIHPGARTLEVPAGAWAEIPHGRTRDISFHVREFLSCRR
jgi:hypothetical protein